MKKEQRIYSRPARGTKHQVKRWLGLGILLALACVLTSCATLHVDGRDYLLHVPKGTDQGQPKPLVIVLHGGGSRARAMPRFTGMNAAADAKGFIVAYPQGKNRHWNDGRPDAVNADDLAFINTLIGRVASRHNVDTSRVYAAGISNGAMFAHRLACDLSARIAGIAAVAGTLPAAIADQCHPSHPVSVLQISGTDDPIVPYNGGKVATFAGLGQGGQVLSAPATLAFWRKQDQCGKPPPAQRLAPVNEDDPTRIVRRATPDCADGTAVVLYRVEGGGHAWPGGPQYLPKRVIGRASTQLNATTTMVDFFLGHPRK